MLLDSDRTRIRHMVEAARQALEYSEHRTVAAAEAEPPIKALLIRNLEILGEAASRVTPELRTATLRFPGVT